MDRLPGCKQLEYASVTGMTLSPDGNLWIATSEGMFIVRKNGLVTNYTEKNSKVPQGINNIFFDKTGNAWIGGSRELCLYIAADREFKVGNFQEDFFNNTTSLRFTGFGDSIYVRSATGIYCTNAAMSSFCEVALPQGI